MAILFAYTARNAEGRFVTGSFEAESSDDALAHLRMRALFVTSISSAASIPGTLIAAWPVSSAARVAFFRSFAVLIHAGVPIRRALDVIVSNTRDARLRESLQAVTSEIESGGQLSAAMAKRPGEFPRLFTAMVRAGEIGGALDQVLERLAALLERQDALRKRARSAMVYPLVVAVAAIALVLFLVESTLPAFAAMFAQLHVQLPWSTRALIAGGRMLRHPGFWLIAGAGLCAGGVLIRALRAIEGSALVLDRAVLALPAVGAIVRKATVARFARTLGTLLRCGVPLLTALEAARDVIDSALYSSCARELGAALREGTSVADALERSALFDALALQLVRVGEETGALDTMLLRVAEYCELDVETAVAALGSVVEPTLIVILGAVVGLIVASILIPLYQMVGSIA